MILPDHAGVANAIGAVVGRVTFRASATITSPVDGLYRVHFDHAPVDFSDLLEAIDFLKGELRDRVLADAKLAGAEDIQCIFKEDIRQTEIEGRTFFVEATIAAEASGRPRITA